MAQDGAPVERACDRCRERRVKCDKRHPACLRCEKLGKPCPGYDKKRKFVDEGISLRKKYHAASSQYESGPAPGAPQVDPNITRPGTGQSDLVSPTARLFSDQPLPKQLPEYNGPALESNEGRDKPGWNISNFDVVSMFNPGDRVSTSNDDPDAPLFDADRAFHDILNDPALDPAWFNLDPSEYYGSSGNSCGFLSDIPNIVDEIDRDNVVESIERSGLAVAASDADSQHAAALWEPQLNTSAHIVDEREHEMAYLIRHFREAIGPIMDLFDQEEHFGSLVPLKALRDSLLRNAIAAVSAKQLGRVKSAAKPYIDNQYQKPAMMEVIDEVDWFYKAANYYDKAIAFSRIYLQAISRGFSQPPSPDTQQQATMANSDDLLVAVSIFSLYEWMDNLDLDWSKHLSGLKTLLNIITEEKGEEMQLTSSVTVGRRASFWNFTRADYHAAYLSHQYTLLDTEDLQLWHSCGLQIQAGGPLYHNPAGVKEDPLHCRPIAELVAHTMLWLVLRIMNYLASADDPDLTKSSFVDRESRWSELSSQLDDWHNNLPQTFQPCAQMRYPMKSRTLSHSNTSQLTEVYFSMNVCAAALQLYHFARILMLNNRPKNDGRPSMSRDDERRSVKAIGHAHQIIGIALGRPHPAVRVEMLLPLYLAGTCLEAKEERRVVLELLRAIEKDTGCSTEARCLDLMEAWEWSEVDAIMA